MIGATHWSEERARRYEAMGAWAGETLATRFAEASFVRPDRLAIVDGKVLTFRELEDASSALGTSLQEIGIGRGDVVSMQLPNWWEAAVVTLACSRIGAILNPLQMIYRQGELRFILNQCRSKALIVPQRFKRTDYAAMAREVAGGLEQAVAVITVRGGNERPLERLLGASPCVLERTDPNDIALLLYTSGTTAAPKGVLHTHNTLMRSAQDLVDLFEVTSGDRVFMASPITHVTGLLLGFIMPWMQGAGTVLLDQWDPDKALELVLAHECSFTGGAPPFLSGLMSSVQARGLAPDEVPLTRGPCGGADVPPSLIREAAKILGARFTRIYGSTEGVTVTGTYAHQRFEFAAETDGMPLPGHEIRIVDASDQDVPQGSTGEIMVRGPSNFVGYFDASLNRDSFTADGFFRMGDLGSWDEDGCLRIQGRKKDIIIRNGENIAAKEVEDILVTHPMIDEVALVGVPDPETGERACAYIIPRPGFTPTLSSLCEVLAQAQIAKQKYPEYLVLVDALPRTASGKVQKFKLREDAKIRDLSGSRF